MAAIALTLLLTGTLLVGTAAADDVSCGDVITQSTTLTHDLGPCPGNGLIVRGDGITLDLGGHRIFAANGPEETVGVRIGRSRGVTVQNGTVEGFDAGVEIAFGGGNTVQRITAINNVNDLIEPFEHVPGQALPSEQMPEMLCFYGDGITTSDSDDNVIRHNRVLGNGPYGGITLVGDSDGNRVEKNEIVGNNIQNFGVTDANGNPVFVAGPESPPELRGRRVPAGSPNAVPPTGLCGATLPGSPGMQRGRRVQAIGVRIEGPGADENVIRGNHVDNSALVGISIHSWVCNPEPGEPRPGFPNERNLITKNTVRRTGLETFQLDSFADGIGSLAQGPIGRVTCTSHNNTITGNNSSDNMRHGYSVHLTVQRTEVSDNVASRNGGDGIFVAGPALNPDGTVRTQGATNNTLVGNRAHQSGGVDGRDGNSECDNNDWRANRFLTVNQECVAGGGTGWVGGPGNSGQSLQGMGTARGR